jgi:DNA-3-methyladenine glycosylase II
LSTLAITPRGPFSLAAAADFVAGFPPAGRPDAAASPELRPAFLADDLESPVGVTLRDEDGDVRGSVQGRAEPSLVRAQVARILSLDHDATGFEEVGRREPVVARLQRAYPGLRPVLFHSPYEAAAWSVISARLRAAQAVAVIRRIEERAGAELNVDGQSMSTFRPPARLLELRELPGLPPEKLIRLHGVAQAALEGRLDPVALRAAEP